MASYRDSILVFRHFFMISPVRSLPWRKISTCNLEALGFRNLGVEARPHLAVLRRTKMPALLIEVGFLDSESDNHLFDTRFDEIAQAIADGIMDTLQASSLIPPETGDTESEEPPLYRVQVGAFHNLQNAVALEQELKRMGYNTWIVTS